MQEVEDGLGHHRRYWISSTPSVWTMPISDLIIIDKDRERSEHLIGGIILPEKNNFAEQRQSRERSDTPYWGKEKIDKKIDGSSKKTKNDSKNKKSTLVGALPVAVAVRLSCRALGRRLDLRPSSTRLSGSSCHPADSSAP